MTEDWLCEVCAMGSGGMKRNEVEGLHVDGGSPINNSHDAIDDSA